MSEKQHLAPDVERAIDGMHMLAEVDKYFNRLDYVNGTHRGETLHEEILDCLGQVATAMVDSCNDKELFGCQVFRALHAFYKGPVHHADVAERLICSDRLDVSDCERSFCMLQTMMRHK